MATVSTKLTLDTSGFNRGIKSAESSMSKFKSMAGGAAMAGIAAGFAAAAAAAAGLAVGVKGALDLGGALSDLSTRTGVAAGELRVLQEAFTRNGLSAEQVGPAINKMQRAIVEASQGSAAYKRAFESLGLSLEELSGMDAAQQFSAIGNAINAISNPMGRTAAAMQLFGRSGGEMLTLFANADAMTEAARAVGDMAGILTRNANLFDKASDILGNVVKTKLEGFFVGMSDTLVPGLMALLEAADGIDLSGLGQDLGNAIAFGLTIITSGNLGNMLTAQLKLSGAQFVNLLVAGMKGAVAFFGQRFVDIGGDFSTIMAEMATPDFWKGIDYAFKIAAYRLGAALDRILANINDALSVVPGIGMGRANRADVLRQGASTFERNAEILEGWLGENESFARIKERLTQSFDNAINAAAIAMEAAGETIDTADLQAARDGLVGEITTQMEANREAVRARFDETKTQTPLMEDLEASAGKSNTGIIAQSLQKVGGGAAFARFSDAANPAAQAVREQQKTNNILSRIENKIAPQQMALMPA